MRLPTLVAIGGRAGAGKDTLADMLVEGHGYRRTSFAEPIKRLLNDRFGWRDEMWLDRRWKEHETYGGFTPREWAQWLGTDIGRRIDSDVWCREWARLFVAYLQGSAHGVVVADLRFDNEAQQIRALGGCVVWVERAGHGAQDAHASESGIARELVDLHVMNHGPVTHYWTTSLALLRSWHAAKCGR